VDKPVAVLKPVWQDFPEDPRKMWDHVATMVCWSRDYILGDVQPKHSPNEWVVYRAEEDYRDKATSYWDDMHYNAETTEQETRYYDKMIAAAWRRLQKEWVYVPLYAYIHSGISISVSRTYPFNDPWDSGQLGWVYIPKDTLRDLYGVERISKKRIEQALAIISAEVEEYNNYLTGQVWSYILEDLETGEIIDSCGGFYDGWDIVAQYVKDEWGSQYEIASDVTDYY